MKNIILVEGEQDKRFIEQVLVSQNLIYTRVQEVNVNVMNGENALKNQLQTLKEEAEKGKITHLGKIGRAHV